MTFSTAEDINRIANGMMDRTLPKSEWTHAAHFASAVWLLKDRSDAAFIDMPGLIRAYNEATGGVNTNQEGYHETITVASLRLAQRALEHASEQTPIHEVVNDLLAGEAGKSGWIFQYWSKETLFSVRARREWVAPDLKDLPF